MAEEKKLLNRIFYLFDRYISNECSEEELDELLEALHKHSDNKKLDFITDSLWKAVNKQTNVLPTEEKKRIFKAEIDNLKEKTVRYKPFYPGKHIIFRRIAAAAILIIVLAIGSLNWLGKTPFLDDTQLFSLGKNSKTYLTADTDTKTVRLGDGSMVTLNRGTKLSIDENQFNKKQREVWLEGEAFFDVATDPDRPFIIHTGDMNTTVRGTSFNVKAYPQLNEQVVSVLTGKVEVGAGGKMLAMLTPDKQVVYKLKNNTSRTMDVDASETVAWKDGKLVFINAGIEEIKLRLKQRFNTDMEIRGNALNDDNMLLNSIFPDDVTLAEVLKVIGMTADVGYELQEGNKVVVYTLSPRK